MSFEIKANHVFTHAHGGGKFAITFIVDNGWINTSGNVAKELAHKDIKLVVKQFKETKSNKQVRMVWGLIKQIADIQSGFSNKTTQEELYCAMIEEAKIRTEFNPIKEREFERIKDSMNTLYRVIKKTPERFKIDQDIYVMCECYRGLSQFDTKEANDFIEVILNYASETIGYETQEQIELRKYLESNK
ncbi:MAG: hypothetical protein AB7E61_07125 [Acholeplasmataceae bacterium]